MNTVDDAYKKFMEKKEIQKSQADRWEEKIMSRIEAGQTLFDERVELNGI